MARVPRHDLRRQEADEADLDGLGGARAVGQFFFDDQVGLDIGLVTERIGCQFALDQVG
jgi:hypothetical protein